MGWWCGMLFSRKVKGEKNKRKKKTFSTSRVYVLNSLNVEHYNATIHIDEGLWRLIFLLFTNELFFVFLNLNIFLFTQWALTWTVWLWLLLKTVWSDLQKYYRTDEKSFHSRIKFFFHESSLLGIQINFKIKQKLKNFVLYNSQNTIQINFPGDWSGY